MTVQRRVILEELRAVTTHPTADELFHRVRDRLPNISLGTVYRNLDVLVRNRQARRIENGGGQCRFDGDMDRHYHIRCVVCGRVDDVAGPAPGGAMAPHVDAPGYEVTGFRLEYEGICASCRKATERPRAH